MKLAGAIASHRPVPHGGPFSVRRPDAAILDFSSSVSPAGAPPLVKKYLRRQLDVIDVYPDPDSVSLKKSLSWYTGLGSSQITAGNGATEIIYNFGRAFLSKNTRVLIAVPAFGEYEAAARLQGSRISFFKTMNIGDDIAEFSRRIPKNGCVFVCNPNNPTGALVSKNDMSYMIESARKKSALAFVDECFIELVPDADESVAGLVKRYDNLLVLRSLTKSFGLAGARIGYALGSRGIIGTLERIKIPWNVSGLAQKAAGAAICHSFHLKKAKRIIKKESQFLRKEISGIDPRWRGQLYPGEDQAKAGHRKKQAAKARHTGARL